jgi:hypothetical protein
VPFLPHEPRRLDLFADPPDDDAIHHFEHEWHALVQGILFFFGIVNAGVLLRGFDTGSVAMIAAALVGRPLGILAAVGAALLAGLHLPRHLGWRELVVVALASSSGFMIALFFATGVVAIRTSARAGHNRRAGDRCRPASRAGCRPVAACGPIWLSGAEEANHGVQAQAGEIGSE